MILTDHTFSKEEVKKIRNLIGTKVDEIALEDMIFSNDVTSPVMIKSEDYVLIISNECKSQLYHGMIEDVCNLHVFDCGMDDYDKFKNQDNITPLLFGEIISGITIVNECVRCYRDGVIDSEYRYVHGVVLKGISGREIGFEKGSEFIELITITRGYELIKKKFTKIEDMNDEEQLEKGIRFEISREIIGLKAR